MLCLWCVVPRGPAVNQQFLKCPNSFCCGSSGPSTAGPGWDLSGVIARIDEAFPGSGFWIDLWLDLFPLCAPHWGCKPVWLFSGESGVLAKQKKPQGVCAGCALPAVNVDPR